MTMIVVGGYVHLQKQKQTGTTSSTGSTPAHGISMSAVDAPISMDMRPNDAALAAAAVAESQPQLSHEGNAPRGIALSVASA